MALESSRVEFDNSERTSVEGVELRFELRFFDTGLLTSAIDPVGVPNPSDKKIGHSVEVAPHFSQPTLQACPLVNCIGGKAPSLLLVGSQERLNVIRLPEFAGKHIEDERLNGVKVVSTRVWACLTLFVTRATDTIAAGFILSCGRHSASATTALQKTREKALRFSRL